MKNVILALSGTRIVAINVDHVETLSAESADGDTTHVTMISGDSFVISDSLRKTCKRMGVDETLTRE